MRREKSAAEKAENRRNALLAPSPSPAIVNKCSHGMRRLEHGRSPGVRALLRALPGGSKVRTLVEQAIAASRSKSLTNL